MHESLYDTMTSSVVLAGVPPSIIFNPFLWILILAIISPFWYRWKGKYLIADRRQRMADAAADRQLSKLQTQLEPERTRQFQELKIALPKMPPQRMRAVFAVNKVQVPVSQQKVMRHLLGEPTFSSTYTGAETKYSADMILELTESERAIIREHRLDDVVLEDEALYSQSELVQQRIDADERADATKDILLKEITKVMEQNVNEISREQRRKVRVGDLLVSPYSRVFDTYHEAHDYLDKLKTKHIPKLRELIDKYGNYKPKETIEF
jgi:hypothetical protein